MLCSGFVSSIAVKRYDFGLKFGDELLSAYRANLRYKFFGFKVVRSFSLGLENM